jgi:hypothetical protein
MRFSALVWALIDEVVKEQSPYLYRRAARLRAPERSAPPIAKPQPDKFFHFPFFRAARPGRPINYSSPFLFCCFCLGKHSRSQSDGSQFIAPIGCRRFLYHRRVGRWEHQVNSHIKGSFGRACSGSQGTSAPGRKFPYTRETQGSPPKTVIYSCPFGQQRQGMQWKKNKAKFEKKNHNTN